MKPEQKKTRVLHSSASNSSRQGRASTARPGRWGRPGEAQPELADRAWASAAPRGWGWLLCDFLLHTPLCRALGAQPHGPEQSTPHPQRCERCCWHREHARAEHLHLASAAGSTQHDCSRQRTGTAPTLTTTEDTGPPVSAKTPGPSTLPQALARSGASSLLPERLPSTAAAPRRQPHLTAPVCSRVCSPAKLSWATTAGPSSKAGAQEAAGGRKAA